MSNSSPLSRLRSLFSPSTQAAQRKRRLASDEDEPFLSLDELAKIVLKLSDEVRVEREGRVALEVKLARMEEENLQLRARVDEISKSPPSSSLPPSSSQRGIARPLPLPVSMEVDFPVTPPTGNPPEENDLSRSLVLARVPEPRHLDGHAAVQFDYATVCNLLAFLGCACLPICVYRMPFNRQSSYDRLLKVILPSSKHQRIALMNAPRLGRHDCPLDFRDTYVRASIANKEDRPRPPPRRTRPPPPPRMHRPPSLLSIRPRVPPPPPPPPSSSYNNFPPLPYGAHSNRHGPSTGNW